MVRRSHTGRGCCDIDVLHGFTWRERCLNNDGAPLLSGWQRGLTSCSCADYGAGVQLGECGLVVFTASNPQMY
jgi:hypothetical protein